MGNGEIILLTGGFLVGLFLTLVISFLYFFGADKSIFRKLLPLFSNAKNMISHLGPGHVKTSGALIHPEYFLDSFLRVRRCRDVSHYSQELIDNIFKRHHFAAVISVLIAYLFLMVLAFSWIIKPFRFRRRQACVIFFAILIGVSGAITYFLQSWSIPVLVLFLLVLNLLYRYNIIDPTSKAYGLDYSSNQRPVYSMQSLQQSSCDSNIRNDKQNMEGILNRWKKKQDEKNPCWW
jgi:hypothetical protein